MADLSVTKDAVQSLCCDFAEVTFIITVTNNGPDDADAPNTVTVTDEIPAGMTFVGFLEFPSCALVVTTVVCSTQTLDASEVQTFRYVVVAGTGTYLNTATVSSDLAEDLDLSDNTDSVTVTILESPP